VQSSMLHESETWRVRKRNEVAEMRMVRWMRAVEIKDKVSSKEFIESRSRVNIRLRGYGHVLRKEDTDWVKKSMEYEAESSRPRGRPKRTWREVVQKD